MKAENGVVLWLLLLIAFVFGVGCGPTGGIGGPLLTDGDAGASAATDARPAGPDFDAAGGAGPLDGAVCAGYVNSTIAGCWYMGAVGDSCVEACAPHGGFDAVHARHVGRPITLFFFPAATQIPVATSGFEYVVVGDPLDAVASNDTVPNPISKTANLQLACACRR